MGRLHGLMKAISWWLAVAGGIILIVLIALTCVSILGRSLNTLLHAGPVQALMPDLAATLLDWGVGPVDGDFEIVQAGVATAIFAFLPWCQITGGHATVDLFTLRMPGRVQRWLGFLWEAAFAVALVIIARQLELGMQSKIRSGQTTFILQFPVWWGYAGSLAGATLAAVVSAYLALVRLVEAVTGQDLVPGEYAEAAR